MKIKYRILLFMVLLVLVAATAYGVLLYASQKRALLEGIDAKLEMAARAARAMFPPDYHDRLVNQDSVPPEQYLQLIDRYNKLCLRTGLQYLWSVLLLDPEKNTIVFTSSTTSDKNLASGKHALFFDVHRDPQAFREAFRTMTIQRQSSFDNEWGQGRMVLVPEYDGRGRKFAFGASMLTSEVETLVRHVLLHCVLVAAALAAVGVVLSAVLANSLATPLAAMARTAEQVADGELDRRVEARGSAEQVVLARSFNRMTDAVQARIADLKAEVAARQRAEAAAARLVAILDSTSDLVAMGEPDGHLLYLNRAGRTMLGWDDATVREKRLADVVSPTVRPQFEGEAIPQATQAGPWSGETLVRAPDGREIPVSQVVIAHPAAAGEPAHLSTIARDITERKHAETRLRESEESLRITLDSIGDAVIATDAAGRVVRMNPIAAQLTGWPESEARGRELGQVFHILNAETKTAVEAPVARVFREGRVVGLANHTLLLARDGRERQIADSGAPIRNDQGAIVGVVLVFRDVTEQYQLEEQLRQTRKLDAIGRLAGGVAHDFNNMLSGILGAAEVLATRLAGQAESLAHVALICQAAERAADLTQKLLTFSRKTKAQRSAVDLHVTIDGAVQLLERSIDRRIRIVRRFAAVNPWTFGDPSQLQNALLNLGINARDAMPAGGDLIFATANLFLDKEYCAASAFGLQPGEYVEITVIDTGVGMSREVQQRIFEPFFTTKPVGEGTGLGLTAVYAMVREGGGLIEFVSEPGRGTTFRLCLPVTQSAAYTAGAAAEVLVQGTGRILLVEDEPLVRDVACQLLTELGYRVLTATDGEAGVEAYRQHREELDLVILDLIMPKLNGADAFRALRQLNPQVKVLIATGYAQDLAVSALLEQGVIGLLTKPYRWSELSRAVAAALAASPRIART